MHNAFFYLAGLLVLAAAKAQHLLTRTPSSATLGPRTLNATDIQHCIESDIRTVTDWLSSLETYTNGYSLEGQNVLELRPKADLGIGLYLLAKGCFQYNTCDVYDCMRTAPNNFYRQLFGKLSLSEKQEKIDFLRQQLAAAKAGYPSRINRLVRDDSDLVSAFGNETVDLVFSQSALEHFEDISATMAQLHSVCKPGAILVSQVELTVPTQWMRKNDPNNIYRYAKPLYNALRTRDTHNRVRPFQYQATLERHGWTEISIYPVTQIDEDSGYAGVNEVFRDRKNQMNYLSIVICAKNGDK